MSNDAAWKTKLAETTGQWAFVLSLSRRQIAALEVLYAGNRLLGIDFSHWHSIESALERRGLIVNVWEENDGSVNGMKPGAKIRRLEITPAGKLVCELLILAGQMKKPHIRLENVA